MTMETLAPPNYIAVTQSVHEACRSVLSPPPTISILCTTASPLPSTHISLTSIQGCSFNATRQKTTRTATCCSAALLMKRSILAKLLIVLSAQMQPTIPLYVPTCKVTFCLLLLFNINLETSGW